MAERVRVDSEIGELEEVVVHSPGSEIEAMTPSTLEEVLYNDIVPLGIVADEHRKLKSLLERFATVRELATLLKESLLVPGALEELVEDVVRLYGLPGRREELLARSADALIRDLVGGLKQRKDTLSSFLSRQEFDLHPLPNLYFTRDSAMVFGRRVLVGAMAHRVRWLEAVLAGFIFRTHPALKPEGILLDRSREPDPALTLEGGDFQVLANDVIVVGVSERTTSGAVDELAERIGRDIAEPLHIFAVLLPRERATIHLDMIFTTVDVGAAVVYAPHILGGDRRAVVRIDVEPGGGRRIGRCDGLLEGLAEVGIPLSPILCGGRDPLTQQREQWMSGANLLAVAPGKVIGYACNEATFEELDRAGFTVRDAEVFLSGAESVGDHRKLAIGIEGVELARGGGGVRCMTMPVRRKPFDPRA